MIPRFAQDFPPQKHRLTDHSRREARIGIGRVRRSFPSFSGPTRRTCLAAEEANAQRLCSAHAGTAAGERKGASKNSPVQIAAILRHPSNCRAIDRKTGGDNLAPQSQRQINRLISRVEHVPAVSLPQSVASLFSSPWYGMRGMITLWPRSKSSLPSLVNCAGQLDSPCIRTKTFSVGRPCSRS